MRSQANELQSAAATEETSKVMTSSILSECSPQGRIAILDGAAKLVHGTLWTGLATAMNRALPGVMTLILTWVLHPDELGSVAFVIAYYTVLSMFADWGIVYALQKFIPENQERQGIVAWTALATRLLCSVLVAGLCFALDRQFHIFRGYGVLLELLIIA